MSGEAFVPRGHAGLGTRRRFLRAGAAAAPAALVAACGAAGGATPGSSTQATAAASRPPATPAAVSPPAARPSGAARPGALTWIAGANPWQRPFDEWVIDEWAKVYPSTRIEPLWTDAQSIPQKALISFAAGDTSIDVVVMGFENVPAFVSAGSAAPLNVPDVAQFSQEQIRIVTRDGKPYAVPWFVDVIGHYYNKALYRQAGLNPERPPETLDQLVEYSTRLTRSEVSGLTFTVKKDWGLPTAEWLCLLYALGGYPLTENTDRGQPALNTPVAVRALQFWTDLRNRHKVVPPDLLTMDGEAHTAAFARGKVAAWSAWQATMSSFIDHPDSKVDEVDIGFGLTPYRNSTTNRTGTWSGGWAAMVPALSKNRDTAEEFVNFLASPGPQKHMALTMTRCARNETFQDPDVLARWPHMKKVGELVPFGKVRPTTQRWFGMNDALMDAIRAAVSGQATPQKALDDAQKKAQAIWATG